MHGKAGTLDQLKGSLTIWGRKKQRPKGQFWGRGLYWRDSGRPFPTVSLAGFCAGLGALGRGCGGVNVLEF